MDRECTKARDRDNTNNEYIFACLADGVGRRKNWLLVRYHPLGQHNPAAGQYVRLRADTRHRCAHRAHATGAGYEAPARPLNQAAALSETLVETSGEAALSLFALIAQLTVRRSPRLDAGQPSRPTEAFKSLQPSGK